MTCSDNGREWHVYSRLGDVLTGAGVQIPDLYPAHSDNGQWWLLIEDVPGKIAQDNWLGNRDIIEMLQALHQIPVESLGLYEDRYVPSWPESLSQQALTLFSPIETSRMTELLEIAHHSSQGLFEPGCLVSADPNPADWGVRTDGTPVLFDCERCALAHPAIDLFIIVPDLGSVVVFDSVSRAYAGDDSLAEDIARAKVWSVVEFLAGSADGSIEPAFDLANLVGEIPSWLAPVIR